MSLALQICAQANVPAIAWGPPGTGKTAFVEALSAACDWPLETVIASECEPTDFGGLPFPVDGEVRRAPPDWFMRLHRAGKGLVFLDEYSCAPPTVQKATLRFVRSRMIANYKLPDEVRILLAANPPEDAADGYDLAAPAANRLVHLDWPFDPLAWAEAAVANFPAPKIIRLADGWQNKRAGYMAQIAAFVRCRPDLGCKMPKDEAAKGRAWASGRTWDMGATLMAAADGAGANEATRTQLLAGCVGDGAALEFLKWSKTLDLPDPETILANPGAFRLPERGDRVYAVLSSVVAAVANRNDAKRWTAGCEVLGVAAAQGSPDLAAAAARSLMPLQPKGAKIPANFQAVFPVVQAAGLLKQR